MIDIAAIVALAAFMLLYAYNKTYADLAWRDDRYRKSWHPHQTLFLWMAMAASWLMGRTWPECPLPLRPFAWWLVASVIFEGTMSWIYLGYWWGRDSRTLPIEWLERLKPSWRDWIDRHLVPVRWGQMRLDGWLAPASDGFRLALAATIWWLL